MRVRERRAVVWIALLCSWMSCAAGAGPLPPQAMRATGPIPVNTWEGWHFEVPAGWQAQPTTEAMLLTPEGAGGADRVRLLAPQAVNGGIGPWFARAVVAQASGLRGFRLGGPVKEAKTTHGVPTLFVTGQGTSPEGQRVVASYLGMLNQKGEGLLMVAEFSPVGALRNLRSYGALVNTLEPVDGPPAPGNTRTGETEVASPPASGGVRGSASPNRGGSAGARGTLAMPNNVDLAASGGPPPAPPTGRGLYDWFGSFYNSIVPGPNFTIASNMVWEFYRFFPNGYLYEGMPAGVDPASINCTGPAQMKGGRCKHYVIEGGMLTIDGEKPQSFAETRDGIKVGGTEKNRVRPAHGTLNGTWKTSSGGGIGTTVTLSQHMLTLRPDGTFALEGSTGVSGANVAAYNSSALSGRYKLSGYTIEMDYNNGRVVRQSFLLPYPDDKVFLIGDSMYFVPTR